MKPTSWIFSIFYLLSIFVDSSAFAHGGDSKREEPKPEKIVVRVKPSKAETIDQLAIEKILNDKKLPHDVTIINCSLSTAPCRGITVELFDESNSRMLVGFTGMNGIVGFHGLDSTKKYTAKIVSEKYEGSVAVISGRVVSLVGDRITK